MNSPFMIMCYLAIGNLVTLIFGMYIINSASRVSQHIIALVTSIIAYERDREHVDVINEAKDVDNPYCYDTALRYRRVPAVIYVAMFALVLFSWAFFVKHSFCETVAVVLAFIQAYVGILLYNLGGSLYTLTVMQRKYIRLEAQIFNNE